MLACVLVDRQDLIGRKAIGYWRDQLCQLCGFPTSNTERLRAARKALRDDGWLEFSSPKNGDRGQTVYSMRPKEPGRNPSSDPGEIRPAKQLTPDEIRSGGGGTRAKSVASPGRNPSSDPGEIRTPSLPIISIPINSPPIPPNPLKGELVEQDSSFKLEAVQSRAKTPKRPRTSTVDDVTSIPIPDALAVPEFVAAWTEWQRHRREIKKPLTPTQARRQLMTFATKGVANSVAEINHTILMGWQGLREPDATLNGQRNTIPGSFGFTEEELYGTASGPDSSTNRSGHKGVASRPARGGGGGIGPGQRFDPIGAAPS